MPAPRRVSNHRAPKFHDPKFRDPKSDNFDSGEFDSGEFDSDEFASVSSRKARNQRLRCKVCQEAFDFPRLTVRVSQGRAHPLCAALKAVGLEKLATTSGRW